MVNIFFVEDGEFFICVCYEKCFFYGIGYYYFVMYCFKYDFNCNVCEGKCFVDYICYNSSVVEVKCIFCICFLIFYDFFIFVFE